MKFKVGDQVLITAGKDKGKKSVITQVLSKQDQVVVKDINFYTRHVKKYGDKSGEKIRRERALSTAKIVILNDKNQPDRIGYRLIKDGKKERIFKKTGKVIPEKKPINQKNKKN